MPSSESLKLLVQDLIDGRLSPEEARKVEKLVRDNPELAEVHAFYQWLNQQLPKAFDTPAGPLPDRLQSLVDKLNEALTERTKSDPPKDETKS